ncbi:DUF4870 domain-containing protein [Nonomuraea rhizosphaerae]|uniref:DUF4870 domain-containing protein n=1 Tax=Nonomuraea rhizosphaerae TaxID=2665663 RepID=UPI001C5DEA97|nr:DUF4870 domain-containing protein [Nonomuraea rhizosphaerae]
MSQDPSQPPADDDATRRISQSDINPEGRAQQPGYGGQPGSQPGYGAQPGSAPDYGYGAQPGSAPGYGGQPGYGQQPGSMPGHGGQSGPQQPGYGYGQPPTSPPGYEQPGYGYAAPQQRPPHVPGAYGPRPGTDDTTMAMLAHLLGLLVSWIGPLIIYLMKKDESPYVRDQSAEALNFQITMFIGYLVAGLLSIVLIGLILFPIIWIVSLIFHIQAALAANRGENYRYPIAIRMVS